MTDFLPPPGTAYEDLETPRLAIDLPAMEHNIEILHASWTSRERAGHSGSATRWRSPQAPSGPRWWPKTTTWGYGAASWKASAPSRPARATS